MLFKFVTRHFAGETPIKEINVTLDDSHEQRENLECIRYRDTIRAIDLYVKYRKTVTYGIGDGHLKTGYKSSRLRLPRNALTYSIMETFWH